MSTATPTYAAPHSHLIVDLPLDQIHPAADNPRVDFDPDELAQLAKSLTEHGQIEPIVVRPLVKDMAYELIAGERRYRAAKLAGLPHLAAIIREDLATDDRAARALRLIENLHRVQLNPVEEAHGFAALRETLNMTQGEIAKLAGRTQPAIAKRLALLKLPEDVQGYVRRGTLTQSHADALVNLAPWPAIQSRLAALAASQAWPVSVLEKPDRGIWDKLASEQLVERLGYSSPPRFEACKACPFGALRKTSDTYSSSYYCMQPRHYAELVAEEQRRRQEAQVARQAAAQAAADAGDGMGALPLASMEYHTRLDYSWVTAPAGCTDACPCRSSASLPDGSIVPICTDKRNWDRLRQQEIDAAAAASAQLVARRREQLAAYQAGSLDLADRVLPALVARALSRIDEKTIRAACAAAGAIPTWPKGKDPTSGDLAPLSPEALTRIAAIALVTYEIAGREKGIGNEMIATDWLFGIDAIVAEAAG